jgi:hypothetical protein
MSCDQSHPDRPAIRCANAPGNHRLCTGYDPASDEFIDWDNPEYAPPKTQGRREANEHMQTVAARIAPDTRVAPPTVEGIAKGFAESERAAGRWDEDQKRLVMDAIRVVARSNDEFTTDAIWEQLAGTVPVTKGMTAMLRRASKEGILDSTGKTKISSRGGEHDHGQRLTVWYSLIQDK